MIGKREGYPGSGDAATMPPPSSDPSGSPPATEPGSWAERPPEPRDVSDAFPWPAPERNPATEWFKAQLHEAQAAGRTLDPVRAAALHEAVQHEAHRMRPPPDDEAIGRVIAAAKMFEAWLEGPAAFDRYLAEDDQASEAP